LRENSDKPFDELYHREKLLVQNVILAEKELKRKLEAQPCPVSKETIEIFKDQLGPYEKQKLSR
jgi:hypothetical protein